MSSESIPGVARFPGMVALVDFYRLRRVGDQVPAYRALVHTVFGSAFAAALSPGLFLANLLVIALLFTFFGAFDNLCDWRWGGEENGTSRVVRRLGLPRPAVAALLVAPLLALLPALALAGRLGLSAASVALVPAMVLLGAAYVAPPLRLKDTVVAPAVAPVWAVLLFFQGAVAAVPPRDLALVAMLGLVVVALQAQAELMHRVADAAAAGRTPGPALATLRRLPLLTGAAALAMSVARPLLLISVVAAIVRWLALRTLPAAAIAGVRSRVWHPAWCLYELVAYAAFARLA